MDRLSAGNAVGRPVGAVGPLTHASHSLQVALAPSIVGMNWLVRAANVNGELLKQQLWSMNWSVRAANVNG